MEIKLNGKSLSYIPVLPITWEELLSHLLKNFIDKKHGITNIIVDNQEAITLMTETPKKLLSKDIQVIEIFTNNSETIAQTGFQKILKIITSLQSESMVASDLYRESKIKEASESIIKIVNAITPVIFFVNSVEKNFNFNFKEMNYADDVTIKDKLEYFTKSFGELIAAQEKNDLIEIADYLEYQFTDDLNDWEKLIEILLQEVKISSEQSN
jgi:hypothetical protein